MMPNNNDLVYIGGLWKNTTSKGDDYLSGGLGVAGKVLIFKNGNKQSDRDPDYRLYIAPKEKRQENTSINENDEIPF